MKKKLLIGIIVVLGIAAAVFRPMFIGVILVGVCIYLVWMVRKKKASLPERHRKILKIFLLISGVSFVVIIIGTIGHNVVYGLTEVEESVFFTIAIVGIYVFIIAAIGSLVVFLKGRRKTS